MNGIDIGLAVIAVTTALHSGANLMRDIRNRNAKRKRNDNFQLENLVYDTLDTAEAQISAKYASSFSELGEHFRQDMARNSLLALSGSLQVDLVRKLQMAYEHENSPLDLSKVLEDTFAYKRDTLGILEQLRHRLARTHYPPPVQSAYPHRYLDVVHEQAPDNHYGTSATYNTNTVDNNGGFPHPLQIPSESPPSSVGYGSPAPTTADTPTQPMVAPQSEEGKSSFGRFFSRKRRSTSLSRTTSASSTTSSRGPGAKPGDFLLNPFLKRRDEPVPEPEPAPEMSAYELPDSTMQVARHPSSSTQSTYSSHSDYMMGGDDSSSSAPPSLRNRSMSPSLQSPKSAMPPPSSQSSLSPRTSLVPDSVATFNFGKPSKSSHRASTSSQKSSSIDSRARTSMGHVAQDTPVFVPAPAPSETQHQRPSSSLSSAAGSVASSSLHQALPNVLGRPTKHNNYWGFCKGAWTIKENVTKGLLVSTRPEGMYNTVINWKCAECAFTGDVVGKRKPYRFNTRIRVVPDTGIRYRWMFLAKSHVKRKPMVGVPGGASDIDSYGCVFCVDEGHGTGVFGNVATLMDHISTTHRCMRSDIAARNKCAFGFADDTEDWDIHIPELEPAVR